MRGTWSGLGLLLVVPWLRFKDTKLTRLYP
jgi:hypothetical protein